MDRLRQNLMNQGFIERQNSKVLSRPEFQGINYSDGLAEEANLLRILRETNDVSVLSPELMLECVDWVTSYHLSWTRANLLRPFESILKGSNVIEIGAGCGAITRYLGEVAQNVVAVEGSLKRCEINQERVRDLTNVQIVASELSNFETNLKFDVVVVVGVLEYSGLFIAGDSPHLEFLRKAKNLLKPDGKLLLAIENKLGLKYFAGAREDHIGVPMYGIEDRYQDKGVKTFSRAELVRLVSNAGFATSAVHAPVPDYKLVRALVTEQGLLDDDFNSYEFFAQLAYSDPQLTERLNFHLDQTWKTIGDAKLEIEFTNSFLIECSISQGGSSSLNNHSSYWYGQDRKPEYLLEKRFLKTEKSFQVQSRRLYSDAQNKKNAPFNQNLIQSCEYVQGRTYLEEFNQVFDWRNWQLTSLQTEIAKFLKLCEAWAQSNSYSWQTKTQKNGFVDRRLVDLIPRNCKVSSDGDFAVFDLEWEAKLDFELGYLAFRVASDLIGSARIRNYQSEIHNEVTIIGALQEILEPFCDGPEKVEDFLKLEYELFNSVLTKNLAWNEYRDQFDVLFFTREPKAKIEIELDALEAEVAETSKALNAVLSSLSWKITKPLRRVKGAFWT